MKKLIFLCLLFASAAFAQPVNVKTYIPKNAKTYLPILKTEINRLMPDVEYPEYFGGLIEHESCISLTHSRCWSPTSTLSTSRELGIGLSQITKTFNPDGSIRFDSLSDLRKVHMAELKELSWDNVKQRPDLQIRGILLMTSDNRKALWKVTDNLERFKMADAAYNTGLGRVNKKRLQCGLTEGCNPQIWSGNVESINVTGSRILYGNRTAHDIVTHHVSDVFMRKNKYQPYLGDRCNLFTDNSIN